MTYVLIGGLWLDGAAWDGVVAVLERFGLPAAAVDLPATTLADQLGAVLDAVDSAPGRVVVVGHSAACSLAWAAADARPERVAVVVLIGGFPVGDGQTYAEFFPIVDGVMPFPGWGPFDGPDSADLDEEARRAFEAAAVPVAEAVATGVVRLTDRRRYDIPVVLICPEFSPDQARAWIAAGDVPELAAAKHVSCLDIDSGHWPMLTRPTDLAALLAPLNQ